MMNSTVQLRAVIDGDLPIFFRYQQEPEAVYMAAFTSQDPSDEDAFQSQWNRIRANDAILIQTILFEGNVVGHIASFEQSSEREISYWIGQDYWGQGIATEALTQFLELDQVRPLFARAAQDNAGSLRVLEKCGFKIVEEDHGFANARGLEIEEYILKLDAQ